MGKELEKKTPAGLPLEVVYPTPERPDLPGTFPFTRGVHEDMYRGRLWTFRQYSGFGNAHQTNRRFRYLLEQGQTGLSVAFDLPTQIGYDSDDSLSTGEVGKVGVPISTIDDMDALLEGIDLDEISLSMTINSTAPILLAFLIGVARRRGTPLDQLRGTLQNDILKEFIARRTYRFPIAPSMRLTVDIFEYCGAELPRWNPISVSGYHMRESGANAVQEVAFTLANGVAYLECARERGLDLEKLCKRISFFWASHNDFFEEIAKFRAARQIWAGIVRNRFGIKDPTCARARCHTQTAGSTLTFQEPENNAVRVTLQALAAVLGGTQSLHTNGADEALGLPGEVTARTALRTQQILAFESGVANVADPLGGAPFIENLTDELASRCNELLSEIDALGGAVTAIEQGFPQTIIEDEAYRSQVATESGERIVVGVNRYGDARDAGEAQAVKAQAVKVQAMKAQAVDPGWETARKDELGAWRSARSPDSTRESLKTLESLRSAARGTDNLMPRLIDAAESGATLGEICRCLSDVFGEYRG